MSLASLFLRASSARNDRKRDRALTVPQGLVIEKDIPYGTEKQQLLDVYRPEGAAGPLPVIVSVHGGGWVYGDKELYRPYCMDLARRGFAVVNFTYRLSPRFRFPCHLEDTVLAFRWARLHGRDHGMDMDNLFAVGDSAGGHLLALYCCLCADREYAAAYPFFTPEDTAPKAVALNCGVYDLAAAKGSASGVGSLMKDVLGHKAGDGELRAISPAFHVGESFPPCYIMTANGDFLKDQPPSLMAALEEKGVPCEYHCYGDDTVCLGHVFHLDIRSPQAIACNDAECAYFTRMGERRDL